MTCTTDPRTTAPDRDRNREPRDTPIERPRKPKDPMQMPPESTRTDESEPMERVVTLPKVGPK